MIEKIKESAVLIELGGVIVQAVFTCLTFWLLYVISYKERRNRKGIKNLKGEVHFSTESFLGPMFAFLVINQGLASQHVCYIVTNKKKKLYFRHEVKRNGGIDKIVDIYGGKEIKSGKTQTFFVGINSYTLGALKEANALFLLDGFGKKKKIILKKDIQKALKEYDDYKKEQRGK